MGKTFVFRVSTIGKVLIYLHLEMIFEDLQVLFFLWFDDTWYIQRKWVCGVDISQWTCTEPCHYFSSSPENSFEGYQQTEWVCWEEWIQIEFWRRSIERYMYLQRHINSVSGVCVRIMRMSLNISSTCSESWRPSPAKFNSSRFSFFPIRWWCNWISSMLVHWICRASGAARVWKFTSRRGKQHCFSWVSCIEFAL